MRLITITGHKTEKAFMKYIRVTKEQHAQVMMKYFNSTPSNLMRVAQ